MSRVIQCLQHLGTLEVCYAAAVDIPLSDKDSGPDYGEVVHVETLNEDHIMAYKQSRFCIAASSCCIGLLSVIPLLLVGSVESGMVLILYGIHID